MMQKCKTSWMPQVLSLIVFLIALIVLYCISDFLPMPLIWLWIIPIPTWLIPNLIAIIVLWLSFGLFGSELTSNCFEQHLKEYRNLFKPNKKDIFVKFVCCGEYSVFKYKFKSCGERVFLIFVNTLYNLLDFPLHLIRALHKYDIKANEPKSEFSMNSCIDGLVFAYSIISILIFYNENNIVRTHFFAGYYVWRIMFITFSKLRDVTANSIASFNRILFLYILNIVDLVFCFAYLYIYYGVVDKTMEKYYGYNAVFYSLKVFTTQGMDGLFTDCLEQRILVITQLFVFVILFIMVIANISRLKEEK